MANKTANKQDYKDLLLEFKYQDTWVKDVSGLQTKLVGSYAFKNNLVEELVTYVPYFTDADGKIHLEATITAQNSLIDQDALTFGVIEDENGSIDDTLISIEEQLANNYLFAQDNTLAEIVDQKTNSFYEGKIQLNGLEADDIQALYKLPPVDGQEQDQSQQDENIQYATQMTEQIIDYGKNKLKATTKKIQDYVNNSKWYPFVGKVFIPTQETQVVKNNKKQTYRSFREVDVTPFNIAFDKSTIEMNKMGWAVFSEKVNFTEFAKRVKNGEYSYIDINASNSEIINIFDTQESYEFLRKNFPEQSLKRDIMLRSEQYSAYVENGKVKNTSKKFLASNMFGVIDYLFIKNFEGTYDVITFLNGDTIGVLQNIKDNPIDKLPLVLFSENTNIYENLDYTGNLAFKLQPTQWAIMETNAKVGEVLKTLEPLSVATFTNSPDALDKAEEMTNKISGDGIKLYSFYSANPQGSNNTERILTSQQVEIPIINELNQQVQMLQSRMRNSAGITDFLTGSDAHSMESQAGMSSIRAAGLEQEQDVVRSYSESIVELLLTDFYMETVWMKNDQNYTGVTLTQFIEMATIFIKVSFETIYQKTVSNQIIQSMILPLAAQSQQLDVALGVLEQLDITQELKESIQSMQSKMQEAKQKEQDQANQQVAQQNADANTAKAQQTQDKAATTKAPAKKTTTKKTASKTK